MSNVNAQIEAIIQKRSATLSKIQPEQSKWSKNAETVQTLKRMTDALKDACNKAKQNNGDPEGMLTPLMEALTSVKNATDIMVATASNAQVELKKLQDRCDRKTINIAVAGVGRSGKSTALKSILNLDQNDNSIIPSGSGPAVTAGKSTIVSVKSEAEEKTVVKFHSVDSFLQKLIAPFMDSIYQGTKSCYSLDDFLSLDLVGYQKELDNYKPEMNQGVNPQNIVPLQTRKEHLIRLLDIQKNAANLRPFLNGLEQTVPLNQTSKFVSYQRNGEPEVCYAVQEVTIYSRFPNNEIEALKLTDLPGLGTNSESERRCFLDGFNYSVDLALIIRRPVGLFQNYPAGPDMDVNNILSDTFGNKSWEDCAFLFQNDGGLEADAASKAMADVNAWKANGHTMTVAQGNAMDANFMQKTLLPSVLDYMMNTLPKFDQTLFTSVENTLQALDENFDDKAQEIYRALRAAKKSIKFTGDGFNAINARIQEVINTITTGISTLVNETFNENSTSRYDALSNAIREKVAELKDEIAQKYSPKNTALIKATIDSYRLRKSLSDFGNKHIHELRIFITEKFAELENFHESLLNEMRQAVFGIFTEISSSIFASDGTLKDVYEKFESMETNESVEIIPLAIKDLLELKAPFYTLLYPTIRKEVFHSDQPNWIYSIEKDRIGRIEDWYEANTDKPIEEMASNALLELQNLGIEWVGAAEMILYQNLMIPAIVSSALERFEDRIVRTERSKEEISTFVEYYWGEVQNNADAYLGDIVAKIKKITDLVND